MLIATINCAATGASLTASYHPPLDIDCNSTGLSLSGQECSTFVVNYLQEYTGAGNFLDPPAPYSKNVIPIFLRK